MQKLWVVATLTVVLHCATCAYWSMPENFTMNLFRNIYFKDVNSCIAKGSEQLYEPAVKLEIFLSKCPKPPIGDPVANALENIIDATKEINNKCRDDHFLCSAILLRNAVKMYSEGLNLMSVAVGSGFQFEIPYYLCGWPEIRKLYGPLAATIKDYIDCLAEFN